MPGVHVGQEGPLEDVVGVAPKPLEKVFLWFHFCAKLLFGQIFDVSNFVEIFHLGDTPPLKKVYKIGQD